MFQRTELAAAPDIAPYSALDAIHVSQLEWNIQVASEHVYCATVDIFWKSLHCFGPAHLADRE